MDLDLSKLAAINQQQQKDAIAEQRHAENQQVLKGTQESVYKSIDNLIKYLDNRVSKTQVVNQLREIGTPDALKVVDAVDQLHATLKTHKNTDLTEITSVMKQVLDEAKKIPKELPKEKEQKFIDYSKYFTGLEKAMKSLEKAVKDQKLVAEAPIVNVEPKVEVQKPDLKPLQDELREVVKSVKDNKPFEKVKAEQINTLIREEFDEYRITWDGLDDDDPDQKPESTTYYLKGKQVAKLVYKYNSNGKLVGVKKA
jgi:hypothetical protein